MEAPVEDQVTNISGDIQGFRAQIVYLESCMTLITSPEEGKKGKKL
jgi:hypothetical protein